MTAFRGFYLLLSPRLRPRLYLEDGGSVRGAGRNAKREMERVVAHKRRRLLDQPVSAGAAAVILKDIETAVNTEYPMQLRVLVLMSEENVRTVDFVLEEKDKELGGDVYETFYYHVRIVFPCNYPFSGPDVMVSVDNGCMAEGKICVREFSTYHPEASNPTMTLQTFFGALTSAQYNFMGSGFRQYESGYVKRMQDTFLTRLEKNVAPLADFQGPKSKRVEPPPVFIETTELLFPSDSDSE